MPRPPPLRLAADPADADELDRGISVAAAARLIGCDQSYVRKLLRAGKLDGYHLQRGVRVRLSSVRAYQNRLPYRRGPANEPRSPRERPGAKYREAVAALHRLGIRFAP